MSQPLFTLEDVGCTFGQRGSKWFGKSTPSVRALEQINLAIPEDSSFGIVGESGSGKSTLARILVGLLPATSGKVNYQGKLVGELLKKDPRKFRRQVQMVFQDPASSLNPRLRIGEILEHPIRLLAGIRSSSERKKEVRRVLEAAGVSLSAIDRFPHEFSGGQSQRIGIARALAANPRVLVLDEATSALDVSIQAQIIELLKQLRREWQLTLVFISHDLGVVRHLCDRIAVLSQGKLEETGKAEDVFQEPKTEYTRRLLASAPKLTTQSKPTDA